MQADATRVVYVRCALRAAGPAVCSARAALCFDILSALKDGDSRLPRGLRVGYCFAALRRDKSRPYRRSTVV
ncbi:hypothetical protein GCM10018952_60170 [Streptosporangium vulgare]